MNERQIHLHLSLRRDAGLRLVVGPIFEADGDHFRDATLLHCHAVEHVGDGHRSLLVRDDDELTPCGKLTQQPREPLRVRFVHRGINFVQ